MLRQHPFMKLEERELDIPQFCLGASFFLSPGNLVYGSSRLLINPAEAKPGLANTVTGGAELEGFRVAAAYLNVLLLYKAMTTHALFFLQP